MQVEEISHAREQKISLRKRHKSLLTQT